MIASDISAKALNVARTNAATHEVAPLIDFRQGHLLEPFLHAHPGATHLLLIANLPYIPTTQKHELDPDVLAYEPHGALFSGVDGLDLIHELLGHLAIKRGALAPHIDAIFEIDPSQVDGIQAILRELRLPGQIFTDLDQRPRFLHVQLS